MTPLYELSTTDYIIMRFLNFLFILYWLLKDKNNFNNIYIYIHTPYTDTQSTHWCTYIHTTINTHKYNIGMWQKAFPLTYDILSIQVFPQMPQYNRYTYKLQRICPQDLRKPTVCASNVLYSLLLALAYKSANCHADSSIYWHSLHMQWANCYKMPTIDTEWEWPQISVLLSVKDEKESERKCSDKVPL